MATSKKSAKKTVTKKAPAKSAKKTTVKRVSKPAPAMRSFAVSAPDEPFFTFRITHQTLYWLILSLMVLALGAWVMVISARVQQIYDTIDATNAETDALVVPVKNIPRS
ncbi:hypothetical protein EOL96_00370 [Candidatus Saccharibacteria bacterium]|nr:hypothetical protein [Candidatus Saccharibacteria bacterium]